MTAVEYALTQAWASLRRGRLASLFAVAAIALAMTVLGALLLVTFNAERVLAQWTSAAEFSVFLADEVTAAQRAAVEAAIDSSGSSDGREFVPKDEALRRFRREFAGLAQVADGLARNPFPASVEVRVKAEAERDGSAAALVGRLRSLPGVSDVRHDQQWLSRAGTGIDTIRAAGLVLAALMAAAAAVTVAAVVRLGLHARRDEVEIMDLVGAPVAFIRGPFVAEGVLQGGIGAVTAILALWLGFMAARAWWGAGIATALDGGSLAFLPPGLALSLIVGGISVGGLGGFAAARHAA